MGRIGGSLSYNVECDVCGFEYKSHELIKRWDGLMVCKADWESRHPMDFYRFRNDTHKLPYIREGKEKKRVFVNISADITPVTGTWTLLEFNDETSDALVEFDDVTNFEFVPNTDGTYKFQFKYLVSQLSGESEMYIALYKNGSAIKTVGPVYHIGSGERGIGGFYIDDTALTTDSYKVYYKINTNSGSIKAYDNSTCFEVLT